MPTVGAVFAANHKSVTVSSTKDLSNVVLKFDDNSNQKIENLNGLTGTFQASASNAAKCIIGVWIKSGCNQSNEGPGFGEYVSNTGFTGTCAGAETNTDEDNSSSQIGGGNADCLPEITTNFTDAQKRVTITSSMNLNNVVLKFHDNTTQQFNNLFGKSRTLTGTGINTGKCIIGAWIKSGCNESSDGPNYGAYFENTTYNNECGGSQPCGPFFSLRSATWEFCMETPGGIINRNNLSLNSGFTYDGPASSVYFYAQSGGGTVTVNGAPFIIQANRYYLFSGNSQVKVSRNDPSAPGQWMICITTDSAPSSGTGKDRPLSPCEDAINTINPGTLNTTTPGNTNSRPNQQNTRPNTPAPNTRPNQNTNTKPRQNNQGGRAGTENEQNTLPNNNSRPKNNERNSGTNRNENSGSERNENPTNENRLPNQGGGGRRP